MYLECWYTSIANIKKKCLTN